QLLNESPQSVRIVNVEDPSDIRFIPFPTDIESGTHVNDVVALLEQNIPEGYQLASQTPSPLYTANTFTAEDFSREAARPGDDQNNLIFNGNLTFSPAQSIRLRVGGGYERDRGQIGRASCRERVKMRVSRVALRRGHCRSRG